MKNLKILLFILCSLLFVSANAQIVNFNLKATLLKDYGKMVKGEDITISTFFHGHEPTTDGGYEEVFYLEDSKGNRIEIKKGLKNVFKFHFNSIQDVWNAHIITDVLYNLKKKGIQKELRNEMEEDALEYIGRVKDYGLELNDPYLENYIYSLICKIAPKQLIDGRPYNLNLLIQQNPTVNACAYPNGTIVINTGLLSLLHTEDELVAILAHEIAHFVLDHSAINVNKAISRQKRAVFWSSVAVGVTAAAEGIAAAKTGYAVPGVATAGVAALSTIISSQVLDRLGMEFNHEQDDEADEFSRNLLLYLGYDVNALSTVLSRIGNQQMLEQDDVVYVNSYNHRALIDRILQNGTPYDRVDKKFDQMMSFAVSSVANLKFGNRRFYQCLPFLEQNINNNVATVGDYMLKANCLMLIDDSSKANQEIVQCIEKARLLDDSNLYIDKIEILYFLRLNKKEEAVNLLKTYLKKMELVTAKSLDTFAVDEISWAKRMLIKLNGMMLN